MKDLGKRGVETAATLGKRPVTPAAAPVVASVDAEKIEQALADLGVIRERLEASVAQSMHATVAAQTLYGGLRTLAAFVRDLEPEVVPPGIEQTLGLLLTLEAYDPDRRTPEQEMAEVVDTACPECAQGKHPNCTVQIMLPDDTESVCACHVAGHPL